MVGAARKLNTDPASSAPADSTNNWLRQIMMDCSSEEGLRSITLFDSIIKTYIESRNTHLKSIKCPTNIRKIFGRIDALGTEKVGFNVGRKRRDVEDGNKFKLGVFFD
jgi:hypothetical protein